MKASKYFWDLNEKAVKETSAILKNPAHPKFPARMTVLLSRCERPKELFSLISKKQLVDAWPKIKANWVKVAQKSEFRDWWQTVYEQLLLEFEGKQKIIEGRPAKLSINIGGTIKKARNQRGLSQNELALKIGMKQPDISKIEEGKKNITLKTLGRLCAVLGIKKIELS